VLHTAAVHHMHPAHMTGLVLSPIIAHFLGRHMLTCILYHHMGPLADMAACLPLPRACCACTT
jgi:hypothetical protein